MTTWASFTQTWRKQYLASQLTTSNVVRSSWRHLKVWDLTAEPMRSKRCTLCNRWWNSLANTRIILSRWSSIPIKVCTNAAKTFYTKNWMSQQFKPWPETPISKDTLLTTIIQSIGVLQIQHTGLEGAKLANNCYVEAIGLSSTQIRRLSVWIVTSVSKIRWNSSQ